VFKPSAITEDNDVCDGAIGRVSDKSVNVAGASAISCEYASANADSQLEFLT